MSRRLSETERQLFRYVIVGLASNTSVFVVYLLLTRTMLGPKTALTICFALAILAAFLLNKSWTFRGNGSAGQSLSRFLLAYAFGYAVNFLALLLLVDVAGLPHVYVQGCMAILIALLLFTLQKLWVFRPIESEPSSGAGIRSMESGPS